MTKFEHQRDTISDHIRTADLNAHNQLRRAYPLWSNNLVPGAKNVGDVITAMTKTEDLHNHTMLPQEVWELRRQRAGWMDGDATFLITDAMRESVQEAYETGEFPAATQDDVVLYLTPPYSKELEEWVLGELEKQPTAGEPL